MVDTQLSALGSVIKTAYEGETDTNALTDALLATLNSALQSADINTLAELNAIVADATLIDTADSRLSDDRTPTSHTHTESEITDLQSYLLAADINTLAELNVIVADATLIDTTDSRLSDDRTPTSHTHTESEITDLGSYSVAGHTHEGTAIASTGEAGGSKFLREDGDGTCSWIAIPGGGDALTANPLSQFAATTLAQLNGVISDATLVDSPLADIVDDTTPQLGGALDVNGQAIVSAAGGDISLTPDTTGDVVIDGLKHPQADGTAGHFMQTDGAGQLSMQPVTTGSVDNLIISVRKGSVGTITKGSPVFLDGYNVAGYYEVEQADANDSACMPAIGIAGQDITNSATVTMVAFGTLAGMDTSAFSVSDGLYVSDTGTLTATRPGNADTSVQKVATVARSHASAGVMIVSGAFRTNDIPNVMSDAVVKIGDSADLTKVIAFDAAGITTGTTRTITMPDADVDLGALGASPLTTKGDIYGYDTSDARLPVGTDDYVLTADSTQTMGVKWAAAAGGSGGWDVDDDTNFNYGHGLNAIDSITPSSGLNNIGIGNNAGAAITTGDGNVCIGSDSGALISTDSYSVCIGHNAMKSGNNTKSVVIGAFAADALNGGDDDNVIIGYDACGSSTLVDDAVIIGAGALLSGNGSDSVVIGRSAAPTGCGGSSIVIGTRATPASVVNGSFIHIGCDVAVPFISGYGGAPSDQDFSAKTITITGPSAASSASTNLSAGDLIIQGGTATPTGAGVGGDLYIRGGTKGGTGTTGLIMMDNLPTSDPAVAGALWNNSNVLNISAG